MYSCTIVSLQIFASTVVNHLSSFPLIIGNNTYHFIITAKTKPICVCQATSGRIQRLKDTGKMQFLLRNLRKTTFHHSVLVSLIFWPCLQLEVLLIQVSCISLTFSGLMMFILLEFWLRKLIFHWLIWRYLNNSCY